MADTSDNKRPACGVRPITCGVRKEKADAFKEWCAKRETNPNKFFTLVVNSLIDDEAKYKARMELHRLYTMDVDSEQSME